MMRPDALSITLVTAVLVLSVTFTAPPVWGVTPDAWEFPAFRVGDSATYHVEPSGSTLEFTIGAGQPARDIFGRWSDAIWTDMTEEGSWGALRQAGLVSRATGTLLSDRQPFEDRVYVDYDVFSQPTVFGASVLADRVLGVGEVVELSAWAGQSVVSVALDVVAITGAGDDARLTVATRTPPDMWWAMGSKFLGGATLMFQPGDPFPVEVWQPGGFGYERIGRVVGDGEVAWSTTTPAVPWATNPAYSYIPAPSDGGVPESPGATYSSLTIREAFEIAREQATGLAEYEAEHGPAVLVMPPVTGEFSGGLGPQEVNLLRTGGAFMDLLFQAPGHSAAWQVSVAENRVRVAGVEVARSVDVVGEGSRTWWADTPADLPGLHADFRSVADSQPSLIGEFEAAGPSFLRSMWTIGPERQGALNYHLTYWHPTRCDNDDPGFCWKTGNEVYVHSGTGAVISAQGYADFIEAFEREWI